MHVNISTDLHSVKAVMMRVQTPKYHQTPHVKQLTGWSNFLFGGRFETLELNWIGWSYTLKYDDAFTDGRLGRSRCARGLITWWELVSGGRSGCFLAGSECVDAGFLPNVISVSAWRRSSVFSAFCFRTLTKNIIINCLSQCFMIQQESWKIHTR